MKTITRIYEQHQQAQTAARELERSDLLSSDVSLLANKDVSDRYQEAEDFSRAATNLDTGAIVAGPAARLASVEHVIIPGIGPLIAAGWLASVVLGAATHGESGGIVGALVSAGVHEDHAEAYSEAVHQGRTLLAVRVEEGRLNAVQDILDRHLPLNRQFQGAA